MVWPPGNPSEPLGMGIHSAEVVLTVASFELTMTLISQAQKKPQASSVVIFIVDFSYKNNLDCAPVTF